MMEEVNNSPFDRAKKNIKNLANKIDMMQTLLELEMVLDSSKDLPDHEKEGVHKVIELAIVNLAQYLEKEGQSWN
jgi:hypothetical protein